MNTHYCPSQRLIQKRLVHWLRGIPLLQYTVIHIVHMINLKNIILQFAEIFTKVHLSCQSIFIAIVLIQYICYSQYCHGLMVAEYSPTLPQIAYKI